MAVNRIFVKPEFREAFEARFRERARLVETRPGFVRFELLRPTTGDDYLVMTWWASREAFEAWVNSEEFRRGHRGAPEAWFSRPNEFQLYEALEA